MVHKITQNLDDSMAPKALICPHHNEGDQKDELGNDSENASIAATEATLSLAAILKF